MLVSLSLLSIGCTTVVGVRQEQREENLALLESRTFYRVERQALHDDTLRLTLGRSCSTVSQYELNTYQLTTRVHRTTGWWIGTAIGVLGGGTILALANDEDRIHFWGATLLGLSTLSAIVLTGLEIIDPYDEVELLESEPTSSSQRDSECTDDWPHGIAMLQSSRGQWLIPGMMDREGLVQIFLDDLPTDIWDQAHPLVLELPRDREQLAIELDPSLEPAIRAWFRFTDDRESQAPD